MSHLIVRPSSRSIAKALLSAVAIALLGAGMARAAPAAEVGRAIKVDRSPPLRSLAPLPPPAGGVAFPARRRANPPFGLTPFAADPVQQLQAPTAPAPALIDGWDGVPNVNGYYPPDTEGDVGPTDYVQWVNASFEIWSKSGVSLYGPAAGNTLWSGFGGLCQSTNQGDPVVVYDRQADRWVFTQFAFSTKGPNPVAPYYMCIAVSTSGDPTGSYYRFAFHVNASTNYFPDYPKLGVWPGGYYMTTNNFNGNTFAGAGVFAFDRSKMLTGDSTAGFVSYQLGSNYEGLLPSNLTGPNAPPAGSPNYVGAVDTSSPSGTGSTFQIWKLHADFSTPSSSSFTGPTNVAVAPYTFSFCREAYSSSCIPQPGTSQTLDPLADRLLYRLNYRNFGDHESLVATHTVNVGSGSDRAGMRWYEIRSPGSSPTVYQQGTFAPADSINRWMGSIAMDGNGDIALGYSQSASSGVYPSVGFTGRLAGDPAGTMTLGEGTLIAGGGSQTGSNRWGDYSTMSIDPSDDLTFWYTQEYYSATSATGWRTRIGSFRLAKGPLVTLTSPANGTFTNNSKPTFSGTAGADAGDSAVTVDVYSGSSASGTPVATLSASVGAGGAWSVTSSSALAPDGIYTARAQQSDAAGNTGFSSSSTFTVDTTPPVVTLTAPTNGVSTNDATPTYSGSGGTATGDLSTVTVKVYSGSSASGSPVATLSASVGAGGAWSVTPSSALTPDGIYTARAQQSDAAGNTGFSSPSTFTVDTTPPVVTLTAPANGSYTNTAAPTFSGAAGTVSGDDATITVKVYAGSGVSGSPVATLSASVGAGGAWSVTSSSALTPDGIYTARAQQSDAAGNTGFSSSSTFTVDTTPPVVTLTAPTNGVSTNDATPTYSGSGGTATGDLSTVTVKVYSGSSASGTPVQTLIATASGGAWSVPGSGPLADGSYTARAQQSDAAGNTGFSSPSTFTVDTTPPVVTLTAPANGGRGSSAVADAVDQVLADRVGRLVMVGGVQAAREASVGVSASTVSATSKSTASGTWEQSESRWKARICSARWFSMPQRCP